jgi:hypothetical protein
MYVLEVLGVVCLTEGLGRGARHNDGVDIGVRVDDEEADLGRLQRVVVIRPRTRCKPASLNRVGI